MNTVPLDEDFKFFNPKFGLTYTLNGNNSIYASYARANKEPNRNDFESNATDVKHETLNDFELGWRHQSKGFSLNANLYYMQYNNQLVLTGALDNVGEYTPSTGIIAVNSFEPSQIISGQPYLIFSVSPETESNIKPLRNFILKLDTARSSTTAIVDRQTTSLEVTV